jgi:hypothetical protein
MFRPNRFVRHCEQSEAIQAKELRRPLRLDRVAVARDDDGASSDQIAIRSKRALASAMIDGGQD